MSEISDQKKIASHWYQTCVYSVQAANDKSLRYIRNKKQFAWSIDISIPWAVHADCDYCHICMSASDCVHIVRANAAGYVLPRNTSNMSDNVLHRYIGIRGAYWKPIDVYTTNETDRRRMCQSSRRDCKWQRSLVYSKTYLLVVSLIVSLFLILSVSFSLSLSN